ncbi:MAG: hypothetical protein HY721_07585 [Planctomycetes bacterium]|nr:hypothetical protein [Planctomycetota bacterium]
MREPLPGACLLVAAVAVSGCAAGGTAAGAAAGGAGPRPQLFHDLGSFHGEVSTRSEEAQRWFDQGLLLTYAFNHEEAGRSFEEAARIEPECAMAWWGMALCAGPNINNPAMDEAASGRAHEASRRALSLAKASPGSLRAVERDLIEALVKRYEHPPPPDRKALDAAYAGAMRDVHRRHPDDPDVSALFAEALLDLRPWDQWTPSGDPQPGTLEVVETLEAALARRPDHPGANHYYIHAVEASPRPERALAAAERLGSLAPGAGHLVHMPAHIFVRLGRYADASIANEKAIAADRRHVERAGAGGTYAIYRAHNHHFLALAAMFERRSAAALEAARDLVAELPEAAVRAMPEYLDGLIATPLHVLVRFGRWGEILREPEPPAHLPATRAFWRYARGVALSVLGRLAEAAAELAAFDAAVARVPEGYLVNTNNTARAVLEVVRAMLEGELLFRKGELERA